MKRSIKQSLLALGLMAAVSGCDELLQVSNPNNIAGDDVLNPVAASALANGALSGVARGYANILTSYSTVTDELRWSGSRDAYQELDFGNPNNPFNEFVDAQYPSLAQGNWMAREAVRILTIHEGDGNLTDATDLDRAHLYLAISYIVIGDMFDDWAYSDRATANPPVGAANMVANTYDLALTSLARAAGSSDGATANAALAFRARAEHGKATWAAARSGGGLVASAAANTAAAAALAAYGNNAWTWEFNYSAQTVGNGLAGWVNNRQEMAVGITYASPDPTGAPTYDQVTITDPIDVATVSPIADATITGFTAAQNYPSLTMVSAREMLLIMAEHESASSNTAGFTTHINTLRALDGLTAFSGQVSEAALIEHHRMTDLFFQGRRLTDMYRFGTMSPEWQANSVAATQGGVFFPLTVSECATNEHIPNSCS